MKKTTIIQIIVIIVLLVILGVLVKFTIDAINNNNITLVGNFKGQFSNDRVSGEMNITSSSIN